MVALFLNGAHKGAAVRSGDQLRCVEGMGGFRDYSSVATTRPDVTYGLCDNGQAIGELPASITARCAWSDAPGGPAGTRIGHS